MRSNKWFKCALLPVFVFALGALAGVNANAAQITESEFRARVEAAAKDLQDLSMVLKVVDVNKKALEKADPNYARLLELKSAKVSMKLPDKMKIEGKLGMVKFEYIINGGMKITKAPAIRFQKREDYSDQPAKLQGPLDMGLITPSLWQGRRVEVMSDDVADAAGEIKLRLRWLKGDMSYVAVVDAEKLCLKNIEKRDAQENIKARVVYSNPKSIGNLFIPTTVELYTGDGTKVGTTEISELKYNIGLQDSIFK